MKLASYKGTRPFPIGLCNVAIRFRLESQFSHSEVVFEPSDMVDSLMPDGTTAKGADGSYWCASSVASEKMPEWSPRRAGKSGGVRFKRIVLDPDHWEIIDYPADAKLAAEFFSRNQGVAYDWSLIAGYLDFFVNIVRPQDLDHMTCSEACAAAGQFPQAYRFDPAALHYAVMAMNMAVKGECPSYKLS